MVRLLIPVLHPLSQWTPDQSPRGYWLILYSGRRSRNLAVCYRERGSRVLCRGFHGCDSSHSGGARWLVKSSATTAVIPSDNLFTQSHSKLGKCRPYGAPHARGRQDSVGDSLVSQGHGSRYYSLRAKQALARQPTTYPGQNLCSQAREPAVSGDCY